MYSIHTENEKDKQAANAIEEEQLSRSGGECQISSSHIFYIIAIAFIVVSSRMEWAGQERERRDEIGGVAE